jgi:crotonobetainyl-CoA:carnitine CoA-transferase CaiB-like acyl-CoA transferase
MLLAELGARVIKVERPPTGDTARMFPPMVEKQPVLFGVVNRGRESIALDIDREADRQVLREMVRRADVVVENFRPGTTVLEQAFSARTAADWVEPLQKAGVACGVVNTMKQAVEDPQIAARNMIVRAGPDVHARQPPSSSVAGTIPASGIRPRRSTPTAPPPAGSSRRRRDRPREAVTIVTNEASPRTDEL